jgi:chitin biosynthesis protein CHS5
MMPIHPYYLGASPVPAHSTSYGRPQSMSQASISSPTARTSSPKTPKSSNRQSMPAPSRTAASPPVAIQSASGMRTFEPTPEETHEGEEVEVSGKPAKHARTGTMSKDFRFPPAEQEAPPPLPDVPPTKDDTHPLPRTPAHHTSSDTEEISLTPLPVIQSTAEMPPPPPVEKERSPAAADIDEDVGETEEISLN